MKRNFALIFMLTLILLMTACSSTGDSTTDSSSSTTDEDSVSSDNLNSTIIWRRFDDSFQSGFRIIMQNEAEDIGGITLDMQDGEDDPVKTNNKLETALTKGTTSIAICAPDRECTSELMNKCKAEDVPVVFFNMEPMEDTMEAYDKIYYIGANADESGDMCAQALINYWNKNTEIADKNGDGIMQIVVLQGEIGQQDVIIRTQAYEDTLKASGIEYEILAIDTANWDQAQALDKMNTWITSFGLDSIEGVLCNNDAMAMGAVQAALNNGYNKGEADKFMPIVGIDATVEALQSMKDGALLGTVLNDRSGQSRAIISTLKALDAGQEINESIFDVECTVDGKYIWVPYVIVDDTNLDQTLELMTEVES